MEGGKTHSLTVNIMYLEKGLYREGERGPHKENQKTKKKVGRYIKINEDSSKAETGY